MEIELPATPTLRPSISALVDIERTHNDKDGWDCNRYVLHSVSPVTMYSVAQISQQEVTDDDSTTGVPVTRMSISLDYRKLTFVVI